MSLRTWLDKNGTTYAVLLAVSLMGIGYLLFITAMKLAGTPFEPIDPIIVAVLSIILAVLAGEHSKSNGSPNGE